MAKKIDLKRTLGNPTPTFDASAIEEMTRMIHTPKSVAVPEEKPKIEEKKPVAKNDRVVVTTKKEKPTPEPVQEREPAKRGRKPSPPATDERMIRVSVDLPESLFIQLKTKVIMDRTDMKTFVWRLVEKELKNNI